MIKKCRNCAFRNIFLITNQAIFPTDGDECGIYGLGKCDKVYYQYCNGKSFSPQKKESFVQLTLQF